MTGETFRTRPAAPRSRAVARDRLTLRSSSTRAEVGVAGAAVLSLTDVATETEYLLRTPWADEDWSDDHPSPSTSETWHRRYPGGWHTLLPHAGEDRELGGVTHPFHGEAAWRRWRVESADESSCTLGVLLRTVPLAVTRTVELVDGTLTVRQTVTNVSRGPVGITWTEHPVLGEVFVSPSTTVDLDGRRLDLVFPEGGSTGGGFRTEPSGSRGSAVVRNPATGAFALLDWDQDLFPFAHVWQEHGTEDYPWWGAVSGFAIEPATREYWPDGDALGPLIVEADADVTTRFTLQVGLDGR
ncbi:hypothetical protein [Leifsonia lichenia]